MAIDFSAFDEKVDLQELQNEVQNAPDNDFADGAWWYIYHWYWEDGN